MDQHIIHKDLIIKRQKLQQVAAALKEKFLGLDDIIEEVISLLMPWYLFPEAQLRPTIINLWGLTGSGKTALVQSLVDLLDHRKLYSHIDMGEFESNSANWIKHILTDDLSYFHEKPALLCLDEFQFAKTLDASGNELGKDKLRVVWDLIDSGKIEYIPGNSTYYLFRADNCLARLDKAIKCNVRLNKGIIDTEVESFMRLFEGFYFENYNNHDKPMTVSYFMSDDFVEALFSLFDTEEYSKAQIRERILVSSLEELAAFIREGMRTRPATKTLDLSHSLIFVLGNLDEAYTMSNSMNPDISADEFNEQTSKITIAHIKRALRKRFRAEQIARLGNNHIIYKSFNNAQFRMLIRQELNRVGTFVLKKFGWKISFDESVVNVVYAEGVFPAQGTRPVLTTIKNLIESRISSLVVSILEHQLLVEEITWLYEDGKFAYTLKDKTGVTVSTISDDARLKLENLRKSIDPEIQAHTAVHEAGHAVLAALTLRIIPALVVSRTASDAEGFCLVNFPKGPMTRETLKKDIIITLGGYVAERLIFGDELTSSGVYSDIEIASALANKAIRKFAMGMDPIHIAVTASQNEDAFFLSEKYAAEAVKIIKECEIEAELILIRNKLLLLKMSEYLTVNSRMEEQMIEQFVKMYGKEAWLKTEGFISKDQYYQFNTTMQQQLKSLEQDDVDVVIEKLIADVNQTSDVK
jgi:cell division protease FtsH